MTKRLTPFQITEAVRLYDSGLSVVAVSRSLDLPISARTLWGRLRAQTVMRPNTWPIEERFWAKVVKTNYCWVWRGAMRSGGYGHLRDDPEHGGGRISAHQLSLRFVGREPTPDQDVHHTCRNPPCVNPDHLIVENRKGRQSEGETSHQTLHAKWNKDRIILALHECAALHSRVPIAMDFNASMAKNCGRNDLMTIYKEHEWPSTTTVRYYFGSWANAVEEAGFERPRIGIKRNAT